MRASSHLILQRLVVVGTLGLTLSAQAQIDQVQPASLTVNVADCDSSGTVTVQWTAVDVVGAFFLGVRLEERPSGASACPQFAVQEPLFVVEPFAKEAIAPTNGTLFIESKFTAAELIGPLCTEGVRRDALLCLYGSTRTDTPTVFQDIDLVLPAMIVSIDTEPPEQARISSLIGSDGVLTVNASPLDASNGDAYTFLVQHRACPDSNGDSTDDAGISDGGTVAADAGVFVVETDSLCDATAAYRQTEFATLPAAITGLKNGRTYEVRVIARDDFGNDGEPSVASLGTPVDELTPLTAYDGTPNFFSIEGPGCASAPPIFPLALGGTFALLRRRRRARGQS